MRSIKIASRTSALALWQANAVKTKLEQLGYPCIIIPIESTGDLQLTKPIYALGVSGVFTKQLDAALLNDQADIAVHSLKDVPTQLAENIVLAATLERGSAEDVVLMKNKAILENNLSEATIATSSLRRRAQWLAKYPKHKIVPIRGNVQTRLKKFEETTDMDGVIFAKAGLERLNLLPDDAEALYWMLPAPAQGIIGIACRNDHQEMKDICKQINDDESFITGWVERQFLNTLMGGCSVPVSALARISGSELEFEGAVHSFDGSVSFRVHIIMMVSEWKNAGKEAAEKLLQQKGAPELMQEIRNKNWDEEGTLD
ncbi:MAG: porphobilinogen deaminase [Bacteroidota bacterium]|nr:porphobilinogen deaminase [Bacteroidota bacterium]